MDQEIDLYQVENEPEAQEAFLFDMNTIPELIILQGSKILPTHSMIFKKK